MSWVGACNMSRLTKHITGHIHTMPASRKKIAPKTKPASKPKPASKTKPAHAKTHARVSAKPLVTFTAISVRVDTIACERFRRAASREGMSLSDWIRSACRAQCDYAAGGRRAAREAARKADPKPGKPVKTTSVRRAATARKTTKQDDPEQAAVPEVMADEPESDMFEAAA